MCLLQNKYAERTAFTSDKLPTHCRIAYVEFDSSDVPSRAVQLTGSLFLGRALEVCGTPAAYAHVRSADRLIVPIALLGGIGRAPCWNTGHPVAVFSSADITTTRTSIHAFLLPVAVAWLSAGRFQAHQLARYDTGDPWARPWRLSRRVPRGRTTGSR